MKQLSSRYRQIVALGLPVIGGMVSQNVLNIVDTAMVGWLGDEALAAVGTGSFVNFMAVAFVLGLSAGVQAVVARRVGEGRQDEVGGALNAALLVAVGCGLPIMAVVWAVSEPVFELLNPDAHVVELGVPYLRLRLCAAAFVGMNFAFRGYWNGINRPSVYMRTLIAMHVVNITLNWVFIYGHLGAPAMGSSGAALASAIAVTCGTILYFAQAWKLAPGFLTQRPSADEFMTIARLSAPNGLQQLLFATGFTVLFGIIGRVGTDATAAANVLINLMLVCILPGLALGIAGASLVGQALGRGDADDARQWGWDVVKVGMLAMGLAGLPMLLCPEFVLQFFLHGRDSIEVARIPLQLIGASVALDAVGMVLMNCLAGAGATRTTAAIVVGFQWLLFLPAAYVVGPVLGYGLLGIWIAQVTYRLLQASVFAVVWQRGSWRNVHV